MTESSVALNFSNPSPMAGSEGNENEKCNAAWKNRRMSVEQRRSLEKSFEVESKLEPKRKSQIAQELGLHPRQVTVWFQNKRARCKTQELEKDYVLLKLDYSALESSFEAMQRDNEKLATELNSLKEKFEESQKARSNNVNLKIDSCQLSVSGDGSNNFIADTSPVIPLNGTLQGSENEIYGYVSTDPPQYCYNTQSLPLWDWA